MPTHRTTADKVITGSKASGPKPSGLKAATAKTTATKVESTGKTTKKVKRKMDDDDDDDDDDDGDNDSDDEDDEDYVPPVEDTDAKFYEKRTKAIKTESNKKRSGFHQALNRDPPRALGSRELPVGKDNCFANTTFVVSGIFETLTSDQVIDLIKRYGGRVTGQVSSKTTYLLRGRDCGESKTRNAKRHNTKILDEDQFYKLFETAKEKPVAKPESDRKRPRKDDYAAVSKTVAGSSQPKSTSELDESANQLWTEKYRPKTIGEISGNKETVRKISSWLEHWPKSLKSNFNDVEEDIQKYRSVLISGPPGIGKTTAALVVAKTNGYHAVELNASDTRNKKSIQSILFPMLNNRSVTEFYQGNTEDKDSGKVVLIMDEVDGMSGGDRGGSAELASLIRKTKIPIICICNDVRSDKVKPLLNVCFDARFKRTPASQLRSRLMSIAYRENLKVEPNAIDELVQSTHNDMRQIINILSTYKLSQDKLNYDSAKKLGKTNEKYSQLNIFDIPGQLLDHTSWQTTTLAQKSEVYFHDYSLSHLMMFESYLKSNPSKSQRLAKSIKETDANAMSLAAMAADMMADGDIVDSKIHGSVQQYSLMPVHSIFSCVLPAYYMEGRISERLYFPGWLGQNSKATKFKRLLTDMRSHMRLQTSSNAYEIRQDYVPALTERIFSHLKNDEIDEAIETMNSYYMQRETLDTLNDLALASKKPMTHLTSQQKTKFTRRYNENEHPVLFQSGGELMKRNLAIPTEEPEGQIFEEETFFGDDVSEEEAGDEDISKDKLIKQPKKKKSQKRNIDEDNNTPKRRRKTK
ncbi:replication factor RFC1 C terminal domain-containing protein [Dichotomocladium elegans]|nr:replication factor RFC1 C terminal domain-containing protein [Dichotomocladium elegans]